MALTANQALPWLIDVDVFEQAVSHVNWDQVSISSSYLLNAYKASSAAQNDEISFDEVLAAGTWDVELLYIGNTGTGIYSVQFDGVTKGTIDGYQTSTVGNLLGTVSGVSVPQTKKVRLTIKMATKNASSSNYWGFLQHIQLRRTV
jgi:hypothetical protein